MDLPLVVLAGLLLQGCLVNGASFGFFHHSAAFLPVSLHRSRHYHFEPTEYYPPQLPKGRFVFVSAHPGESSNNDDGIRLNKVFKATHSRREADALIESGRVSVNGNPVHEKGGFKVRPFLDEVALDGVLIEGWEAMNGLVDADTSGIDEKSGRTGRAMGTNGDKAMEIPPTIHKTKKKSKIATEIFEYIKYWKPRGITCTTDRSIRSNIIDDLIEQRGYQPKHRVYPVGRLDKDTSGLILLTSDGRLPNSALRGKFKQPKVYQVLVNRPIEQDDLNQLQNGVVITTTAQRDGKNRGKSLTAPTLPCQVDRISGARQRGVTMTLVEGRNRQIRKMMQALGYEVVELHRVQFMGIALGSLQQAGEWKALDDGEMMLVENVLHQAITAAVEEPQ